ncbi:MAG: IPT/TIG domain-containing protein, partial [Myxococcota bacterium]
GQSAQSRVVQIGMIEDTVAPEVAILEPRRGEVLVGLHPLDVEVRVADIGAAQDREVFMDVLREVADPLSPTGWTVVNSLLPACDPVPEGSSASPCSGLARPMTLASSDETNATYLYSASVVSGEVLVRGQGERERVRLVVKAVTPNHAPEVVSEHEMGLPIENRIYRGPKTPDTPSLSYITAVDHDATIERKGPVIAAFASNDPMATEPGLGHPTYVPQTLPVTGIMYAEAWSTSFDESGNGFFYDVNAVGDAFVGTITEIVSDDGLVFASKTGLPSGVDATELQGSKASAAITSMVSDPANAGELKSEGTGGEVLILSVEDGEDNFGLPYLLRGRAELPYPEVHGLARTDGLVLAANGYGGVIVFDVRDLLQPYRVGFIKPNGYARDVVTDGEYAYIAASHEGLLVADLADPTMPIVATLDLFGVANRLTLSGGKVYVTEMAGEGFDSRLAVIDVTDPYRPAVEEIVELQPQQLDLVPDGAYDVSVSGGKAFVSVLASRQADDTSATSMVEIIDLERHGMVGVDATIPVPVHRDATPSDFAVRGSIYARGALHIAAGKQGLARVILPNLSVVGHDPLARQDQVSTDQSAITIEFSAPVADTVGADPIQLADHISVYELGGALPEGTTQGEAGQLSAMLGEDITDTHFDVAFSTITTSITGTEEEAAAREHLRFVELSLKTGQSFKANTQYTVVVEKGLPAFAALGALTEDYAFTFFTVPVAGSIAPDIESITPASGPIAGGNEVTICGANFGGSPKVRIGGQLVPGVWTPGSGPGSCDEIRVTAPPNYAGPATVEVTTADGLVDRVVGGYLYTDEMRVDFVDPPIVRLSQNGASDEVEIVGFGFRRGLKLRATKHGDPTSAEVATVGDDALRLISSELLRWKVPRFGGAYRGFVDLEIYEEDPGGERAVLPKGVLYGRMRVDAVLETTNEPQGDQKNPTFLPTRAGRLKDIIDIELDESMGVVYVVGAGDLWVPSGPKSIPPERAPRSWIAMVRYDAERVEDAAPMHGLGYYNPPAYVEYTSMAMGEDHLYVGAHYGHDEPQADFPFDAGSFLLVYDRDRTLPEDSSISDPEDRGIVYALPLGLDQGGTGGTITDMHASGDVLLTSVQGEGLLLFHLGDPVRPSLARKIETYRTSSGREASLDGADVLGVQGGLAYVSVGGEIVALDIRRPQATQVSTQATAMSVSAHALVEQVPEISSTDGAALWQHEVAPPAPPTLLGRSDPQGFTVTGELGRGVDASLSLVAAHGPLTLGIYDIGSSGPPQLIDGVFALDER